MPRLVAAVEIIELQASRSTTIVFLRRASVRSRKKCEWVDELSQSIASYGNGWPKYLSFQMKKRDNRLARPIQMSDALAANTSVEKNVASLLPGARPKDGL